MNGEATVFETLQRTAEKEVGTCWSWRARHVISERDYARDIRAARPRTAEYPL